jgi:hypothetical protein
MGQVIQFSTKDSLTAAENLREFIRICKEDLTAFGTDLNWNDWKWKGFVHFTKLGVPSRGAEDSDRLDDAFMDFAKAYFRYQQANQPTGTKNESKALRVIEAALLQVKQDANIAGLDMTVLDEAASLGRSAYSPGAAYHCGREIERLARFVTSKHLIASSVGTWKSPIPRRKDITIQTGREAKAVQEKKLPNRAAFDALAEIFSNNPHNPKDIFTTCTFALSMCVPARGTELLELPADLEWEEPDKNNVMRYGWRYFSGKGYEGDVKWVPGEMVPIATLAVSRILALTKEARLLAHWIEKNPGRFYRHPNCPNVADEQPLSAEQLAAALGVTVSGLNAYGFSESLGKHTLNSLWEWVISRQPDGFPWINKERKIKYSNALFCMTRNMLHDQRGTSPVILWAPDINVYNNDLSPRESLKDDDHKSIFDRWGYKGSKGERLKLTSHQARHLLNTLGNRAGMSQEDIAKWSGRKDQRQNRTYNHMTEFEMVAAAEAVDPGLTLFGPKGDITPLAPITSRELDLIERGPVHVTEFGACVHDWIMSPCDKFRDCLNCQEAAFIKGETDCLERIKAQFVQITRDFNEAKEAVAKGWAGVDRWYEAHEKKYTRLSQLIELLEDPSIPDGSIINLADGTDYSHLRRTLQAKADSAKLQNSPEAAVLVQLKEELTRPASVKAQIGGANG